MTAKCGSGFVHATILTRTSTVSWSVSERVLALYRSSITSKGRLRKVRTISSLRIGITLTMLIVAGCGAHATHTIELSPEFGGPAWADESLGHVAPNYVDSQRNGVRVVRVLPNTLPARLYLLDDDIVLDFVGIACQNVLDCRAGIRRMRARIRRRRPFELLVQRGNRRLLFRFRYPSIEQLRL